MQWYWYLLGGVVALFVVFYGYDLFNQWYLLKTFEPYTELNYMRNNFDTWKKTPRSTNRFVELIRDSRRLPPIQENANPDVVRLQTP